MADYTSSVKEAIKCIQYYDEIELFVGQFIKAGRYGCVYDGVWKGKYTVAIKFFAKTLNPDDQKLELDATQLIKGEYLMKVLAVTTLYNMNCVIMEKYDGTLRDILKPVGIKKKQNQNIIYLAAKNVISGIIELCNNGFSHMDLHQGNILFSSSQQRFFIADYSHISTYSQMGKFRDLVAWCRMIIGSILLQSGRKIYQRNLDPFEDFQLIFQSYYDLMPDWLKYCLSQINSKKQHADLEKITSYLLNAEKINEEEVLVDIESNPQPKSLQLSKNTKSMSVGKTIPKNLQKALKAHRKPVREQNKPVWCKVCEAEFKRKDTRHLANHPGYVKKKRVAKK